MKIFNKFSALIAFLLIGIVAPLTFSSCDDAYPEINIEVKSDYSGIISTINDVNKALSDKLATIQNAYNAGILAKTQALDAIKATLAAMGGTLEEKLASIEAAVQEQNLSLETKLALIETALNEGFASVEEAQDLMTEALGSLEGTLEDKLAAIEDAVADQTLSLETKLDLINTAVTEGFASLAEGQDMIVEALNAIDGTIDEKMDALEKAVKAQTTTLAAKLAAIEAAVKAGFADEVKALGLVKDAIKAMDGTLKNKLDALKEAINDQTTELSTKLEAIEAAVEEGFISEVEALGFIQDAIEAMDGNLQAKLNAIVAAVRAQTLTLETKLALIETALNDGFATEAEALELIQTAVETMDGNLQTKLNAVVAVIRSQTASLETKLELIEAAINNGFTTEESALGLIQEAIENLPEYTDVLGEIRDAITSQTTDLSTKLNAIVAAVRTGFANEAQALGLIQEAIEAIEIPNYADVLGDIQTALTNINYNLSANGSIANSLAGLDETLAGIADLIAAQDYSEALQAIADALAGILEALGGEGGDEPEEPAALETTMTIPDADFADISETGSLSFTWADGDQAAIYSTGSDMAPFLLTSGAGTATGVFESAEFELTPEDTYYALFPFAANSADKTAIPLLFTGQAASGDDDQAHLVQNDYLTASAVANENGKATFDLAHLGSFLRTKLAMPDGEAIDQVEFIPMYDPLPVEMSANLTDGTLTTTSEVISMPVTVTDGTPAQAGDPFTLWTSMPPKDYSGETDDFAVIVRSGNNTYSARHNGSAFSAGKVYSWDLTPLLDAAEPEYGFSSVVEKTQFLASDLPAGQFSGITWLGGDQYAVVHDKLNGGGIVLYTITLSETGTITSVISCSPPGTSTSTVTGRDNEGVAYVSSTNTLFVSAEGDQSIREYDLDGYPTGRSLAVPADMAKSKITSNKGFEALTYNNTTGLFWTVTESPLKKDADLNLLRLQSFTLDDLSAGERYLYRMDAPTKTEAEASAAQAYVFGVPALAALDDGRILVLEREVYVPNSTSYMELLKSFTKINIYVVNPSADGAGILRKTLVKSFTTNVVSLANYEGMCVGPTLSDGSICIILIPDSQGGQGGLLKEYVKAITIK